MIDKKELRVGNYIMDRGGKIWQIDCWESENKVAAKPPLLEYHPIWGQMYGHPLTEEIEYLQPIPLTSSILESCGFKKWGRDDMPRTLSYELDDMRIFPANSFCNFEGYGFMHYKLLNFENGKNESAHFTFQYIHQLQNLFYLKFQKELEIKL